ncbi:calcium-translocating P-type ATPase, PMCA-type [Clostridium vincentii]|uniref:P-type Ca(2+) transporter n=1 Tax=Clostridium vincentii TaxID=52704 RepID=A0A2T0B702_9CLOT|nr:calcium-translocating P-type ATPase, PMCA-type [Clostridium vincentii]PRR79593.1 Calcium-transporting ATPase 1 [Clostridium vincentii]
MWFKKSPQDVITELIVNPLEGLTTEEANIRLARDGENRLAGKKKKSLAVLFFSQINDAMIYILIAAAIISGVMGEISDSIVILIVILINALIGLIQESKAEKALEALKHLSTPKALVKRDGVITEIPSEQVVVGDIAIIDAGRYIPADLRLIESANLKIEESAFTGESLPAEKDANLIINEEKPQIGDLRNMAFMSTLSTYGRGTGVVIATGMNTEIGKIAKMLDEEGDESTPLQKKLSGLGKNLGFAAVIICTLIFIIGMFQGRDWLELLLTSISLAVAAIPEGLPAIVAIVLALGVQRMIKHNAIVKKLPAVETLGSVSIICSDKTGTLTINRMTVKKFFVNNKLNDLDNIDIINNESKILVEGMILCSDATSTGTSKTGDPTEIALLDVGIKLNILKDSLNEEHNRVNEVPFDSDRKLMTTVNSYGNRYNVFTKGAIDSLFTICNSILIDGIIEPLTEDVKTSLLNSANSMSNDALRVLALAYKEIKDENIAIDQLEHGLIFVGLMGMIDPPRQEVKPSIDLCLKAGIIPVMITGDHKNTAFAIGKELGIADNISQCMSGSEIDGYEEKEFNKIVNNYKIFARVSPEHKVKIVKAFKSHGNIVSMTGDGVNDAPSLKVSDIGVAMGITGTDVAKGAADIILTDDNFTTIVNAIEEGRNIYNNIKKSIIFLLSCNLGEILALFIAILLNWATPLLPIHILWVNLITDTFPALSLGVDPRDESVMEEPPRNPKETLFSRSMGLYLIVNGTLIGVLTLFAFKYGQYVYPDSLRHAQTMAFVVLSVSQLFFSLNMRSTKKSIFTLGLFTNKYLTASVVFGIAIQLVIISVPFLANLFKVYPLSLSDWGFVMMFAIVPLVVNELLKLVIRHKQ